MKESLHYKGRAVESLTKEELIEALEGVERLRQQEVEHHRQSIQIHSSIENARRSCWLCGRK